MPWGRVDTSPFHRGDLVVFNTAANKQAPVIKRIAGMGGDVLDLMDDGRVMINGQPGLAPNGMPYIATTRGRRMIGLYKGIIPDGRFLVLGWPGTLDSGRIGLVAEQEITGVILGEQREPLETNQNR